MKERTKRGSANRTKVGTRNSKTKKTHNKTTSVEKQQKQMQTMAGLSFAAVVVAVLLLLLNGARFPSQYLFCPSIL